MKKIYKYRIEVTDDQNIEMPVGAKILTVQTQNGVPAFGQWLILMLKKKEYISEYMVQGIQFKTATGWNT